MECLKIENLSKKYSINGPENRDSTLRDLLTAGIGSLAFWRKKKPSEEAGNANEFYALNDISLSLKQGEALGIVGRNGAGKSTLLKIISRITAPTSGRVIIKGRVSSLLEVGTGFHPELTGRENIYFNGVILGMKRWEIQQKFDNIVAFSGVERFLDTPIKRYSSGMLLKLAFSVAAYLEPEILILDEVLAVGDVEFQNKCFKLIDELSVSGKTILFVSHNLGAVRKLCNTALLLHKGKILQQGTVNQVVDAYLMQGKKVRNAIVWQPHEMPGDEIVALAAVNAVDKQGASGQTFNIHDAVHVNVEYYIKKPGHYISVILYITNADGELLFVSMDDAGTQWQGVTRKQGWYKSVCIMPGNFFNAGEITVAVHLIEAGIRQCARVDGAISFYIVEDDTRQGARGDYVWEWPRTALRPLLSWKTDFWSDKP